MLEFVFRRNHLRALRPVSVKGNRVKRTFRRAHAAADTFIRVYNSCAAAKTSCRLDFYLLFGKRKMCVAEGFLRYGRVCAFIWREELS